MKVTILILTIFSVLILLAITIYVIGEVEYSLMIKRLSKKKTLQEINSKLAHYEEMINGGYFKGHSLDELLDAKEIWEKVRIYKLKKEG